MDKFKACLIAKDYYQYLGIDYFDTFSPMIKPATIRVVLSIVVMNGWPLRQLNVNNAFLSGQLTEIVFMLQPQGFKDMEKPFALNSWSIKPGDNMFLFSDGYVDQNGGEKGKK